MKGRREISERQGDPPVEPFSAALERQGLTLLRDRTTTLQVNVGLLCNQVCRHCHLDAGPGRREIMARETMEEVVAYAERGGFSCVDVTGGAPEMLPGLDHLLRGLAGHTSRLMLRSNLTAISEGGQEDLIELCRELKVAIVASFPSMNEGQADAQRGKGIWERSIAVLRELNGHGFGRPGTGLELSLVVNPAGAYMPAGQCELEKRFKRDLKRRWGIDFTSLFSFSNMPLGRFRRWLVSSGNYDQYLKKLAGNFNAEALGSLMCRTLLSVSWDGYLYDCDFNQASGLPLGGVRRHLSDPGSQPAKGSPIAVGDHCYACTAGSGFT
jgi:radical SAM/Cys-rich protein